VFTDLIYLDLGNHQTPSPTSRSAAPACRPGDPNLSMDLKSWVWTVAGLHSLSATPQNTTNLSRRAHGRLKETLRLGPERRQSARSPARRSGRAELSQTNWDAIIGSGVASFGDERRGAPYYFDVAPASRSSPGRHSPAAATRSTGRPSLRAWATSRTTSAPTRTSRTSLQRTIVGLTFAGDRRGRRKCRPEPPSIDSPDAAARQGRLLGSVRSSRPSAFECREPNA